VKTITTHISIFILCLQTATFAQWEELNTAVTENLNSVYFLTHWENVGYAVGDNGILMKTLTGGDTWFLIDSKTSQNLNDVYFSGLKTGVIVGDSGLLMETWDGGKTWKKYSTGTLANILQYRDRYAICNNDFISHNGWNWISSSLFGAGWEINSLDFINPDTGFIAGSNGVVSKTEDGGNSWRFFKSTLSNIDIKDVHFLNNNEGWVAGSANNSFEKYPGLYHTTQSAQTWVPVEISQGKDLYSIDFFNEQNGIAVGQGLIFITENGGITWDVDNSTTAETLNHAHHFNESTAYIAGDNGLVPY